MKAKNKMKFGLFALFQALSEDSAAERLEELLAQVGVAKRYGFDSILVGQHYLSSPYQMLQPIPLLGRIATVADGMRIGTGIILLPLLNPVAVAEEAATMDVICGGRFILGVGLGYREVEDHAFGVKREEKAQRLGEAIGVIKLLWEGKTTDFKGKFFQLKNAKIGVKPLQKPRPPIWIAGNDDSAVVRAARLGDAWLVNPHASLTTLIKQVKKYTDSLSEARKPFPVEFPIIREAYVSGSDERAFGEVRPYLEAKYKTYTAWGQESAFTEKDPLTRPLSELAVDRFIIGSPSRCVEVLSRFVEKLRVNHVILRMSWPGMKHTSVIESMKIFSEKVLPYFQGR
jgi:alkanesulfonate monooxygenase SsuD/methylene tetrahydromethanopterin reductase-like flavin-dependent oxidoreductase (luciferase family)